MRALTRKCLAGLTLIAVLSGCTDTPDILNIASPTKPPPPKSHPTKTALTTTQRQALHRWILHLHLRAYLTAVWNYTHNPYDWYAIANCETGGNWNMTGSYYSTGLGIMNQAIRENSPPAVAAREMAGTATVLEIVATGRRIEERFGIHAWGCGKSLYPNG